MYFAYIPFAYIFCKKKKKKTSTQKNINKSYKYNMLRDVHKN